MPTKKAGWNGNQRVKIQEKRLKRMDVKRMKKSQGKKQAVLEYRTENRKIRMKQGIIISAAGLTGTERKRIIEAVRKIRYGRKKDGRQSLPYVMELK